MKYAIVVVILFALSYTYAVYADKPKVWFVGDSLAAGLLYSEDSKEFRAQYDVTSNIFIPLTNEHPKGTIEPALAYCRENEVTADIIVIIAGWHDRTNGRSKAERKEMVLEIAEVTGAKIFWFDSATIKEAELDKLEDGVHLSDKGAQQLWARITSACEKLVSMRVFSTGAPDAG